jgi:hypothetical protein
MAVCGDGILLDMDIGDDLDKGFQIRWGAPQCEVK